MYRILFFIFLLKTSFTYSQSEISEDNISFHIEYLSSDSLRGRRAGSYDDKIATNYIQAQFENVGLKMPFNNGLQPFDIVKDLFYEKNNSLIIDNYYARIYEDFVPASNSANNNISKKIAFAGYGFDDVFSNSLKNDYKNIDVKDKWVLLLQGSPKKSSKKFDLNISERDKIEIAKRHNCAGVLIVSGVKTSKEDKLPMIYIRPEINQNSIPIIYITRTIANKLLKETNNTIEDLESKIYKKNIYHSFEINKELHVQTELRYVKNHSNNIVAILEGSDSVLKDEYIVVGAHYDHLGMGGVLSGSRMPDTIAIHNGADDNASGVAGVLELARTLSEMKDTLKRSIIFLAFGAEELGLIGSKYFVDDIFSYNHHVSAMVNFDMIGRLNNNDKTNFRVEGVSTAYEFSEIVFDSKTDNTLGVNFRPTGIASTDHLRFYFKKIPVLFFTTGLHADYHTPFDDAYKINFKGEVQILEFAKNIIINLSRTSSITSSRKR